MVQQRTEDGIVALSFDIDPTDRSLAVMADREHRAEARSVRQLLEARSVVVVGPGVDDESLVAGSPPACSADLRAGDADLVVHAVGVPGATRRCAWSDVLGPGRPRGRRGAGRRRGRRGPGPRAARRPGRGAAVRRVRRGRAGRARAAARAAPASRTASGMRVVGPGVVRAARAPRGAAAERLARADAAARGPDRAVLPVGAHGGRAARRRSGGGGSGCPSSSPPATAPTSPATTSCSSGPTTTAPTSSGLYLESIGNPRKFSRVARRLSQLKPVVVVTAGRSGQVVPPGHAVRATHAPPRTLAEMLRQAGVVRVDNTHQLLDVTQVLAHQPLPSGRRTAILASSASTAALVAEAATAAGLVVSGQVVLLAEDASARPGPRRGRRAVRRPGQRRRRRGAHPDRRRPRPGAAGASSPRRRHAPAARPSPAWTSCTG